MENTFCPKCGSKQESNIFCSKCGHKLTKQEAKSESKSRIDKEPNPESKDDKSDINKTSKNSSNNIEGFMSDNWWKRNFFTLKGCLLNIFALITVLFFLDAPIWVPIVCLSCGAIYITYAKKK